MPSLSEILERIDFSAVAQKLLSLVDTADPCFIAVVLAVLTLLGSKMASPYPALMSWGVRLAVLAFLGYFGYAYLSLGGLETDQFLPVAVRAAIAAGLVLAPMWTVLPVVAFVYGRVRLALAAFLGYAGYECFTLGTIPTENFHGLLLRGLLAAGLALVVAWILQPFLDFFKRHLLPKPRPRAQEPAPAAATRPEERPAAPPVEERLSRRVQARLEAEVQAEMQRRRSRARLKAELCYTLHEAAIGDRLTRPLFEDFVRRYLGDGHDPADVEAYVRELEDVIRQHAGLAPVHGQAIDLTELTRWLMEEQQRIQALELDDGRRKTRLMGLTERYTHLAGQLLEAPPEN